MVGAFKSFTLIHLICGYFGLAVLNLSKHKIFRKENGRFILLDKGGVSHDIPDMDTIQELGFSTSNVSVISNALLDSMRKGKPLQSLKVTDERLPDEVMRVKIGKISALDPTHYWVKQYWLDGHYNGEGAYNPSILKVSEDKILMSWRSGDKNSVLEFGWYFMNNNTVIKDPRMFANTLMSGTTDATMEDARLTAINNETVAVTFSGSFSKFSMTSPGYLGTMMMIAYGKYNHKKGYFDFNNNNPKSGSSVRWLKYPENQKNWVPFMYQDELHFIQSINPIVVLKISKTEKDTENAKVDVLETVVNGTYQKNLPWYSSSRSPPPPEQQQQQQQQQQSHGGEDNNNKEEGFEYGEHIRGGTPTVMVRGVMLSFFHTEMAFTKLNTLKTYFMGAVTFCPNPPFNIHTMSQYPILKDQLYEGGWANRYCNYIMFPMGVLYDENDDNEHLYVSLGYQDRYGIIVKMNIDGLLDSMEFVSNCTETANQ